MALFRHMITAFNTNNTTKTLLIGHPMSMEKCLCVDVDDPSCIFYTVGYDLMDLCTALGLDPTRPIYVSSAPATSLTVIDDTDLPGPCVLIPVPKTTPARMGFQN